MTTSANAPATVQNNTLQQMWQGVLYELPIGGGSIQGNTFQNLQPSNYVYNGNTVTYEPEGVVRADLWWSCQQCFWSADHRQQLRQFQRTGDLGQRRLQGTGPGSILERPDHQQRRYIDRIRRESISRRDHPDRRCRHRRAGKSGGRGQFRGIRQHAPGPDQLRRRERRGLGSGGGQQPDHRQQLHPEP